MVRGRKTKGMVMLLLFLGVAIVSAAPTTNDSDGDFVECTRSLSSYVFPHNEQESSRINVLSNSHLATVSKEFHKPPVRFGELPAKAIAVKSLPPAPGTLLMVLVGFLCVSLVKDRRVWLAALAGLLWAGQAGFSLLPQLASNVGGRERSVRQPSSCSIDCLCEPKHPFHLRSHQKEKQYFAKPLHFAITAITSYLIQAANCSVPKTEQTAYFLKAFIIVNLARGPPIINRTGNLISSQA